MARNLNGYSRHKGLTGRARPGVQESMNLKVADVDSWTGKMIRSLNRLWKRESEGSPRDRELILRIEDAIQYLYRRGRDGRGRRRKRREPTEP